MFTMKPIEEYDVIKLLNNSRFEGELQGYILSDGADLFGYTLFKVEKDLVTLLDSKTPDISYLDGIIRASVAYCEKQGAKYFSFNLEHKPFEKYKQLFLKEYSNKIEISAFLSSCKH